MPLNDVPSLIISTHKEASRYKDAEDRYQKRKNSRLQNEN